MYTFYTGWADPNKSAVLRLGREVRGEELVRAEAEGQLQGQLRGGRRRQPGRPALRRRGEGGRRLRGRDGGGGRGRQRVGGVHGGRGGAGGAEAAVGVHPLLLSLQYD